MLFVVNVPLRISISELVLIDPDVADIARPPPGASIIKGHPKFDNAGAEKVLIVLLANT